MKGPKKIQEEILAIKAKQSEVAMEFEERKKELEMAEWEDENKTEECPTEENAGEVVAATENAAAKNAANSDEQASSTQRLSSLAIPPPTAPRETRTQANPLSKHKGTEIATFTDEPKDSKLLAEAEQAPEHDQTLGEQNRKLKQRLERSRSYKDNSKERIKEHREFIAAVLAKEKEETLELQTIMAQK
ncbi:hypothetical protein KCU71_g7124, partial [Aureobasidium melanogenum]